jgi:molybdopterin/thiamine biosynthesis adenylyltransferase
MDSFSTRYQRQIILQEVGETGQLKLHEAKVLVIGAGGLGCPLLQYLASAGIGTIGLVDGDIVEQSNLARQILYSEEDLGKSKVVAAQAQLNRVNPNIQINIYDQMLDLELGKKIFAEYDIIVDGTDNYETRYLANDLAVINSKPLVSGSVFRFEGQLSVFNYQGGPTYRCLFPDEDKLGFGCTDTGVIGATTGIIGSMMAMEVIKIILELPGVLSGKMLLYDSMSAQQMITTFDRQPEQIVISQNKWKKDHFIHHEG